MEHILELKNVSKAYPKSSFTLDQMSLSLPYGAIMGFVGENGAGKTTTIGCILNTIRKDKGIITLFGKEMLDEDIDLREKIGVVYDGENFPAYLTAAQLSSIMGGLYRTWDDFVFQKHLTDFHLLPNQKIGNYSRGMTMKLAISVALSHKPQLLILDEATSGLEKIADYITFIHDGKLIMTASKNDLVYHYAIMRCKESQFLSLDPHDILTYRKRDFQTDVLVTNGKEAARKYKDIVIDHASVDEIMLLLVKGERV